MLFRIAIAIMFLLFNVAATTTITEEMESNPQLQMAWEVMRDRGPCPIDLKIKDICSYLKHCTSEQLSLPEYQSLIFKHDGLMRLKKLDQKSAAEYGEQYAISKENRKTIVQNIELLKSHGVPVTDSGHVDLLFFTTVDHDPPDRYGAMRIGSGFYPVDKIRTLIDEGSLIWVAETTFKSNGVTTDSMHGSQCEYLIGNKTTIPVDGRIYIEKTIESGRDIMTCGKCLTFTVDGDNITVEGKK